MSELVVLRMLPRNLRFPFVAFLPRFAFSSWSAAESLLFFFLFTLPLLVAFVLLPFAPLLGGMLLSHSPPVLTGVSRKTEDPMPDRKLPSKSSAWFVRLSAAFLLLVPCVITLAHPVHRVPSTAVTLVACPLHSALTSTS